MLDWMEMNFGSAEPLARKLKPSLERRIYELVIAGFDRWKVAGFNRYGDGEVDFTAGLIGHIYTLAKQQNSHFIPLPETIKYSRDVLEGRIDPRTSPRSDISIRWGWQRDENSLTVECKRLQPGDLTREYVNAGLMRFVNGRYAEDTDAGAMIAYVIGGVDDALRDEINGRITGHAQLGPTHMLSGTTPVHTLRAVYRSGHARATPMPAIRLTHLFFDVRAMTPYAVLKSMP